MGAANNHRRWLKRGFLVLLGLPLVFALAYVFRPKPIEVETQIAVRDQLEVYVEEDGRTRVRERYMIYAPIGGNLARIALEPGDRVEAGQPVARIFPSSPALLDERSRTEAEARLAGAIARVAQSSATAARARAASELADKERDRARALHERRAITDSEQERAELEAQVSAQELASAALQVQVAQSEVAGLRALLGQMKRGRAEEISVHAPSSGVVLHVLRESAGPIASGAALIEVGDIGAIEAVVDVLSADAARIGVGARASISEWGREPAIPGRVRLIEPAAFTHLSALGIEEQRVNVIIALDEAPPGLGDNYRVEARILEWSDPGALIVPRSAVFKRGERWMVFVVREERAVLREIELGKRARLDVEVVRGLESGDVVVLYPSDRVKDGSSVRATSSRPRPQQPSVAGEGNV